MQADTLAVEDAKLTAKVTNEANGAEFVLTLTAYKDLVRLHIDEDASKGRFQVVLLCCCNPVLQPCCSAVTQMACSFLCRRGESRCAIAKPAAWS